MKVKIEHIGKSSIPAVEELYRANIREMAQYLEPGSGTKDTARLLRGLSKYWEQSIRACVGAIYSLGYEQDDGLDLHFIRFCT